MKKIYFLMMLLYTGVGVYAQSSATDHFRSVASGNWNAISTWETSPDGLNPWIPATLTPDAAANTITVLNGHTVTNTANGLSIDQTTIQAGGQLTITPGVTWTLANDVSGTDLIVDGTLLNQGGVWTISPSSNWVVNNTGTYIHNTPADVSSPLNAVTLSNNSNFIYRGSGALVPNISTDGRTYGNLSFESTAGSWIASASGAGALTILGNFVIGANVTYSTTQTGLMTFAGHFTVNGTLTNSTGTQNYLFTGVGKTINGTATISFENITINIGASVLLNRNINIPAGFALTVNGAIESGFNQVTGAGGVVFMNGYAGVELLGGFAAMFTNTGGTFLGPASTVEYKGNGAQAISSRFDYQNVIISGTGGKTAAGNSFINGLLTFSNTVINTTIISVITLTVTGSFTGASNASHVDGPFGRQTNSTSVYSFPVGNAGIYRPMDIIPASTALAVFGAQYHASSPVVAALCNPARMQAYTNNEWWDVQRPFGSGNFSVRLNYSQAISSGNWFNGTSAMPNPDNTKAITIAHYNGSCWQDVNNPSGILLGGAASGQVTSGVSSTFGPYTFGYGPLAVLPVNFGNIKAFELGTAIRVEWSNMTETGVIDYKVERSANGRDFSDIGTVMALLNDGSRADYHFLDPSPFTGINYYRVRSTEINGVNKHSIIVKVDTRGGKTDLAVYPNPVVGKQFSLQATSLPGGQYTVKIFNANGQQVHSHVFLHNGGAVTEVIQLPVAKPGLYSLQLSNKEMKMVRTFIIQ